MIENLPGWAAVLIALTSLAYTIVGNRSKALSEKHGKLVMRVDVLEDRIVKIESDMEHLPDTGATHRIELGLEELRGQLGSLAFEMRGQMNTLTAQMQPIGKISDRLQEFLLERANQR